MKLQNTFTICFLAIFGQAVALVKLMKRKPVRNHVHTGGKLKFSVKPRPPQNITRISYQLISPDGQEKDWIDGSPNRKRKRWNLRQSISGPPGTWHWRIEAVTTDGEITQSRLFNLEVEAITPAPTSNPTPNPTSNPTPTPTSNPTSAPTTSNPTSEQEGELTFPPIINNVVNGVLDMELAHRYADFSCEVFSLTGARLLNGILPGPTIEVSAGDTLRILYSNEMEDQGLQDGAANTYRHMDYTNLHFHGAHVSGELPSDDVRHKISPGFSFQYETTFPTTHHPGTHWVHPHVHGSTTLHVSNGAALALIVKDPPNYLPPAIESAKEVLMVIQEFDLRRTRDVAREMGDEMFSFGAGTDGMQEIVRLVNGQYRPNVSVRPNEWMRWRIIFAGHDSRTLDLRIRDEQCEMVLLAKDGIYIQDFPRPITVAPIPTGGRADVMVKCGSSGTYTVTTFGDRNNPTLTVQVSGSTVSSGSLPTWTPDYPTYLRNLLSTLPSSGCTCDTRFRRCNGQGQPFLGCINDMPYQHHESVHSIELGKVVERRTNPSQHSYHQHVYPFQFVRYSQTNQQLSQEVQNYWKFGDWHDVIQIRDLRGDVELRFQPREHLGVMMVHCHRLPHEDRGMMSWEYIYDDGDGICDCNSRLS